MLTVDPSNPVIAAIGRGTAAETTGDIDAARQAYEQAWQAATDDFERCVAAHYVPRTIDDPEERLQWNEDALRFADAVDDERVAGFYPSLHASVGMCRLTLGDVAGASRAFEAAMESIDSVPQGDFRTGLTEMIEERLAEVRNAQEARESGQ
jgi:predicted negative regulator of RcsB-dependent stress response